MIKKINEVEKPLEALKAIDKLIECYKGQELHATRTKVYCIVTGHPCPLCFLCESNCDNCLWYSYENIGCVIKQRSPATNIKRLRGWKRRLNTQIKKGKKKDERNKKNILPM